MQSNINSCNQKPFHAIKYQFNADNASFTVNTFPQKDQFNDNASFIVNTIPQKDKGVTIKLALSLN